MTISNENNDMTPVNPGETPIETVSGRLEDFDPRSGSRLERAVFNHRINCTPHRAMRTNGAFYFNLSSAVTCSAACFCFLNQRELSGCKTNTNS